MRRSQATPNNVLAYGCKARGVLNLLGFSGFSQFSAFCGCNHETVSDLLYKKQKHRRKFTVFARINEAMINRYREREKQLQKNERKYLKSWINGWTKNIADNIEEFIWLDSPGKQIGSPSPEILRQRKLRAVRKRAECLKTLEYIK